MDNPDTYVRARLDADTKERAEKVLSRLGVSVEEVIALLMHRVADEGALPFALPTPSHQTKLAIAELEGGRSRQFADVRSLMEDLERDD